MAKKQFLALAGNIGAGKTTLTKFLAGELGLTPFFEPLQENPYIEDFYADMSRWAFPAQISFLSHRLLSHRQAQEQNALLDRSIYEDANIFAHELYAAGHLSLRDYSTYRCLYDAMVSLVRAPDLIIYLRASVPTLQKRIAQRARSYELFPEGYLERLNGHYETWISAYEGPKYILDADSFDITQQAHREALVLQVRQLIS